MRGIPADSPAPPRQCGIVWSKTLCNQVEIAEAMGSGRLPGASFISSLGRWGVKCVLAGPEVGSKAALFCQLSAISLMSHVSFGQLTSKAPSPAPSLPPFLPSGLDFVIGGIIAQLSKNAYCCTIKKRKIKKIKDSQRAAAQVNPVQAGHGWDGHQGLSFSFPAANLNLSWFCSTPNPPPLTRGSSLYLHPPSIWCRSLCILVSATLTCSPYQGPVLARVSNIPA